MKQINNCMWCESLDISEEVTRNSCSNILKCNSCGLMQVDRIPANLEKIYKESYFNNTSNSGYNKYSRTPAGYFLWQEALVKLFSSKGDLLDVGCATGKLLNILKSSFKVKGIDISDYAVNRAVSSGLDVLKLEVEELPRKERFDIITAFEFVEHVPNIKITLESMLSALNRNGYLFISTPNAESRDCEWVGFQHSLEHITFWTEEFIQSIKKELKDFNLEKTYANKGETVVVIIKKGVFSKRDRNIIKKLQEIKINDSDRLTKGLLVRYFSQNYSAQTLRDKLFQDTNNLSQFKPFEKYLLLSKLDASVDELLMAENEVFERVDLGPMEWNYIFDIHDSILTSEKNILTNIVADYKKTINDREFFINEILSSKTYKTGRLILLPVRILRSVRSRGIRQTMSIINNRIISLLPNNVKIILKTIRCKVPYLVHPLMFFKIFVILRRREYKGVVIYPPTVDWSWMKQRPHQIVEGLSNSGYLCFYINIHHKEGTNRSLFQKINKNLYLVGNLEVLYQIVNPILLISWTEHESIIKNFKKPIVVYDYLDDLTVSAEKIDKDKLVKHKKLLSESQIVTVTADKLALDAKRYRKDYLFLPNACNPEDFILKNNPGVPEDMAAIINSRKPIIGYYGALAKWFDYDLIKQVAEMRKDYEFVLIGPDYDDSIHAHHLDTIPNIHWLGIKKYDELATYLYYFDVAMIPFVINQITEATSPVKIFEYMAGGKQVVSTDLDECRKYKSVYIGKDVKEFSEKIDYAIENINSKDVKEILYKESQENTWSDRVEKLDRAIVKIQGK